MTLTRRQRDTLQRSRVALADVADLVVALSTALPAAHHAAATITTADTPASSWGNSGHSAGDHSDPTAVAVLGDHHTTELLADLHRALIAFRDAGYHAHDISNLITAKLHKGGGQQQQTANNTLHDDNIGRGTCGACDKWCEGQTTDRLRIIRAAGTLRTDIELRMCDACRKAWQRAVSTDPTLDIWAWCDMRRRHIERTTAAP